MEIFILYIFDEFMDVVMAIRIARNLSSNDVIDVLSDLFILKGVEPWKTLTEYLSTLRYNKNVDFQLEGLHNE